MPLPFHWVNAEAVPVELKVEVVMTATPLVKIVPDALIFAPETVSVEVADNWLLPFQNGK